MTRLLLRILAGMLLVLAVSFVIWNAGIRSSMRERFEEVFPRLLSDIDVAKRRLEGVPSQQMAQELARLQTQLPYPARLIDPIREPPPPDVRAGLSAGRTFVVSPARGRFVFISIRGGTTLLVYGPLEDYMGFPRFPLALVIGAICLVVGLAGLVLAAPMARRLNALERAAERIGEGDWDARASVSSSDAIGSVAQQFNLMADRVQELLGSQRQLIQAVSHELRTPAARMRFGLEMLSAARSQEERERRIDSMDEDLSELDQLVEELVLFVRSENLTIEPRPVSLPGPVRPLVDRLAEDHPRIRFELEGPGELVAMADEKLLLRAIRNLLSNAARHARSQVTVGLEHTEATVSIAVRDDGRGIASSDRVRVFEPFARLGESRSRESGGVGLGLTIVKRIVESHGGTATIVDAPEGGAAFVTTWPRVP